MFAKKSKLMSKKKHAFLKAKNRLERVRSRDRGASYFLGIALCYKWNGEPLV